MLRTCRPNGCEILTGRVDQVYRASRSREGSNHAGTIEATEHGSGERLGDGGGVRGASRNKGTRRF
jgi:hypothetical protein